MEGSSSSDSDAGVLRQNYWTAIHQLTYWGQVTHICASKLTIIESDNGLSPVRRQAIIWINAGILLIGGTNFIEILSKILTSSFKKMCLKMLSGKCRPYCLGLNVLMIWADINVWHKGNTACRNFSSDHTCLRKVTFQEHQCLNGPSPEDP